MAKGKKVESVQDETQATQGGGGWNVDNEAREGHSDEDKTPGKETAQVVVAEGGDSIRVPGSSTGNGAAATGRKRGGKSRGQSPDRKYWIVGQRHLAAPQQFLLPLGTVGQARKRLTEFQTMPQYDGWLLSVWRCHRVT